jgi:anaerobic ribonucleoside-triphosphate reductase activating protein
MKIAKWKHRSYAEGPRSNTTLWVSGCKLRCPGCFNPELWDSSLGQDLSIAQLLRLIWKGRAMGDRGAAFVGGEPLDQAGDLGVLCLTARLLLPGHVITIYTGYLYEKLRQRPEAALVLKTAHYLVDGPFVFSLADPNLGYRGSSNQRVIDLEATRASGELTLADWDGLLVYDRGTLSGPPGLLATKGELDAQECGKYGLAPSDPA